MIKKNKILKAATLTLVASSFAQVSHAWFWDSANEREMRVTPEGQVVPVRKESWLDRATTYHEELKPKYNPKTQRVEQPKYGIYDGQKLNTNTPTIKPAWYDRITTYHEEDRRPWNPYTTATKDMPAHLYYDKKEARESNEHYQQPDMELVPYMYGSASLVLRKNTSNTDIDKAMASAEVQTLDEITKIGEDPLDIKMVGVNNDIYIRPAGGFDNIDKRGSINVMNSERTNYIAMADSKAIADGLNIGAPKGESRAKITMFNKPATKLKDNWRDKLTTEVKMARPGDFDYKKPKKEVQKTQRFESAYLENVSGDYGQGDVIASTGGEELVNDYTVESGDTLSEISDKEKIYGDWTLWPLIYDANRSEIKDPDLINPGQNLDIPRNYSSTDINDARYRSENKNVPISLFDGE